MIKPNSVVKPCCRYLPNTFNGDINGTLSNIEDKFLSDEYNKLRKNMINGIPTAGCNKCYIEEESGESLRQFSNKKYMNNNDIKNPQLKYIELSIGNVCNLKCRSCDSTLSSAWINDANKLDDKFDKTKNIKHIEHDIHLLSENILSTITNIKITGGEPFFNKNLLKLMEKIDKTGNIKNINIKIITNGTIFPTDQILNYLNKFKRVDIILSVDAIGEKANYIRHPSNWNEVEKNIKLWYRLNNFHIKIITTVSPYNILYLEELLEWKCINIPETFIHFNIIQNPDYLNVYNFDKKIVKKFHEAVLNCMTKKEYIDTSNIEKVLTYLENSIKNNTNEFNKKFIEFTQQLDFIRNESFDIIFKDLYSLFN